MVSLLRTEIGPSLHYFTRLWKIKVKWLAGFYFWHTKSFIGCQKSLLKYLGKQTFSIMHTKLIVDPMSTCNSPEPSIKASGTTTCKFTKWDITPVDVETC